MHECPYFQRIAAFSHFVLATFFTFRIPVIFQDDLAQIAASHLQENDLVYVSGQLTGDVPPFKHNDGQANIQVFIYYMYCTVIF